MSPSTPGRFHFDSRYRERARLEDGTEVRLRCLKAEDKKLLVEAFARLSPRSRYERFLAPRNSLSETELRYLTELDGVNHFALGAITGTGRERKGLGVARFVRLPEEPEVAEASIVVTDDAQGKGMGRLLLLRLGAAAKERGIDRFRSEVLAENARMRTLIHELVPASRDHEDGQAVIVEMPLIDVAADAPAQPRPHGPLYSLFHWVAQGRVLVRRTQEQLEAWRGPQ
jgi:GNAT superfamily N-acetyltransferase